MPPAPDPTRRLPDEVRVLVACMPKSGSTFLTRSFAQLPGMRRVQLVPGYDRREQEICPQAIERELRASVALKQAFRSEGGIRPRGYVAQHHVRYSRVTDDLMTAWRLRPVVLVRALPDVVMSLADHIRDTSPLMSMAWVSDAMRNWPDDRLLPFIVDMILPWYFAFLASWSHCPDKLLLSYDGMMADPQDALAQMAAFAGLKVSGDEIAAALSRPPKGGTRFNKGVSGRGADLPPDLIARIHALARHCDGLDLSVVGL